MVNCELQVGLGRQMETTGGVLECQVLPCQRVRVIAFGTCECVSAGVKV